MAIDSQTPDSELGPRHRARDRKRWWEFHDKDTYVCPDCLITDDDEGFTEWEVHHINREPGKIVGLCRVCHRVRHGADRRSLDLGTWKRDFLSVGEESL